MVFIRNDYNKLCNELIILMANKTNINELSQAYNKILDLYNINEFKPKQSELNYLKTEINNDNIFNICMLLINELY